MTDSNSIVISKATVKLEYPVAQDCDNISTVGESNTGIDCEFVSCPSFQENPRSDTQEDKSLLAEYVCEVCGLKAGTAFRLRQHLKIHVREKTYHCPHCSAIFQQSHQLMEHECLPVNRIMHKCEICHSKFTHKSSLKNHMKLHSGIKDFKCKDCPAAFINQSQLKIHNMKHTGEKPYKCEKCGDGFATAARLKHHQVTHTEKRVHQCEVCGEAFREKNTLIAHKSVHLARGPYECNMCGKIFPRINSLTLHQRVHKTDGTYEYVPENGKSAEKNERLNNESPVLPTSCSSKILFPALQKENTPPSKSENHIQKRQLGSNNSISGNSVLQKNFQEDVVPTTSIVNNADLLKLQGEKYTFHGNTSNFLHPDIVEEAITTGTVLESQGEDGQLYLIVLPKSITEHDYTQITLPSSSVMIPLLPSAVDSTIQYKKESEENDCNYLVWDNDLEAVTEVTFEPDHKAGHSEQEKDDEKDHSMVKEAEANSCVKKLESDKIRKKEKSRDKKAHSYECKSCGRKCKSSSNYIIHMRTHTGERPYYCGYCGVGFKQVSHLKSHIRIHTGEKPYKCGQCDAAFHQSSQLHCHIKIWHEGKPNRKKINKEERGSVVRNFYCKTCDKTFLNSCFKRQHMKTHKDETSYACNKCESTFKIKTNWKKHVQLHMDDSFMICELCGLHFKDLISLDHHRFVTHNITKDEPEDEAAKMHKEIEIKKTNEVKKKLQNEENSKDLTIDQEGMTNKENDELENHNDNKNLSEHSQMHQCKICKKYFKQKTNLTTHMRVHTDERPYKCDECGNAFHQISHLKDHAKLHSGEKPYKCSLCSATFVQSSAAKRHTMKHHSGQASVIKDREKNSLTEESITLQELPKSESDTVVIKIESSTSISVEYESDKGIFKEKRKDRNDKIKPKKSARLIKKGCKNVPVNKEEKGLKKLKRTIHLSNKQKNRNEEEMTRDDLGISSFSVSDNHSEEQHIKEKVPMFEYIGCRMKCHGNMSDDENLHSQKSFITQEKQGSKSYQKSTYKCKTCLKSFSRATKLKDHIQRWCKMKE